MKCTTNHVVDAPNEESHVKAIVKGLALAALAVMSAAAVADDADSIDYRRHVMISLGEQLAAIDLIVAKRLSVKVLAVTRMGMAGLDRNA